MVDLGSQTQPLQEAVNLLMPDVAPVTSKEEVIGVEGKPSAKENILLVYPFVGGQAIEESAKGLFQSEEKRRSNPMLLKLQTEAVHPRNTAIVTSKDDCKLLNPKGWLNYVLIDFWLQWITRMEFQPDSSVHVFTRPFYKKLEDEGVNAVLSWTAIRGINLVTKKFIYVPIHRNQHWSLMVIINAGLIDFCDELDVKSEILVMLHLDGLGLHDKKEIAANLRCG
jgi:Ulp1 family protease